MAHNSFFDLFLTLLKSTADSENQIVEKLPSLLPFVSNEKLQETLALHFQESKNQVKRLKKIFSLLNEPLNSKPCLVTQPLILEALDWVKRGYSPSVQDAALIVAFQKIAHFEIANYGSLCSLAQFLRESELHTHLDFDDVIELLQASLDEEKATDEKLTDLAEGGFFSVGINEWARRESLQQKKGST